MSTENKDINDIEWLVWNKFNGNLEIASIVQVWKTKFGRNAYLSDPHKEKIGAIDLDELLRKGRFEASGKIVFSQEQWELERADLLEKFNKFKSQASSYVWPNSVSKEAEYRKLLNIPADGPVHKEEVILAYRKLAKVYHPDVGGSEEDFKRITKAKDELISSRAKNPFGSL
jgi:hypothetical protein